MNRIIARVDMIVTVNRIFRAGLNQIIAERVNGIVTGVNRIFTGVIWISRVGLHRIARERTGTSTWYSL